MSPRFGSPEQFARVQCFLKDAGYDAEPVCRRMGIRTLSESLRMQAGAPPDDLLETLIHLFLLGGTVDAARFVPAEVLAAFTELGLVEPVEAGWRATVELYPAAGLHVISDRNRGEVLPEGEQRVFSAITPQTEDFLGILPRTPCPSLLEMCAGAGVAALAAAREYAVQAYAFDLAERSVRFAEFNRRLNGISNATVRQGDLYRPAGSRTYDRIVAHPPYVPVLHATELLRDGGEIGETLTRRIVAGLPRHLHTGGRLYCLALLAEVRGQALDEKLYEWLGPSQREFQVVAIARRRMDPARVVFDNWRSRHAQPGDVERWQYVIEHRRIEAFVYTAMVIERRAGAPGCLLRETTGGYPLADVESLLRVTDVWHACPVARAARLVEGLRLDGGTWRAEGLRVEVEEPFRFACAVPGWAREFLAGCDGSRTCAELMPAGVGAVEFERVVRELRSGGVVGW